MQGGRNERLYKVWQVYLDLHATPAIFETAASKLITAVEGHYPIPKGERNWEHKADLLTGGVLSTRPGKPASGFSPCAGRGNLIESRV